MSPRTPTTTTSTTWASSLTSCTCLPSCTASTRTTSRPLSRVTPCCLRCTTRARKHLSRRPSTATPSAWEGAWAMTQPSKSWTSWSMSMRGHIRVVLPWCALEARIQMAIRQRHIHRLKLMLKRRTGFLRRWRLRKMISNCTMSTYHKIVRRITVVSS